MRRRTDLTSEDGNQTVFVHGSSLSQSDGCQVAGNFLSVLIHGKGWYYQYIRSSIEQKNKQVATPAKEQDKWSETPSVVTT